MDPRLTSILELQEVMSTQQELEDEYKHIPQRRDEIQQSLQSLEDEIKQAQERLKNYQAEQKTAEMELKQGQENRVKKEAQIFSLKTTKEVQATQSEIENIDRKNTRLEEKSLELMENIEKTQAEIETKKEKLEKKKESFDKEIKDLEKAEKDIGPQLEEARENTKEIANRLQPNLYQKFLRVFKGRNGLAIAADNEGHCDACNVKLTPRLVQMAKRGQDIVQCEGCSRFLFWDASLEEDNLDEL